MNTALTSFFLALMCFVAVSQAHMFLLASRGGETPLSSTYFSINGNGPCGGIDESQAVYLNATRGDLFTLSYTIIVNHNVSPAPTGQVNFAYSTTGDSGTFRVIAPSVAINELVNTNTYYPVTIALPQVTGQVTFQVTYDVNGASSPFPTYYQCLDLYIS